MILAKELSDRLSQRAEEFARFLFPNGKKSGNEWCIGSLQGEKGTSLKIHLKGVKAGVWCDFATGQGGDLLDLWAHKERVTILEAMKGVKAYLGIKDVAFEPHRKTNYTLPKVQTVDIPKQTSKVFEYLTKERGLTAETLKAYQIGDEGNEVVFPFVRDGKIVNLKYLKLERPNGKKLIRTESNCEPCLFGWQNIPKNAREITICEGEIDAMTLHQFGVPALSVPFGAGEGSKNEWIDNDFDRLAVFDVINICMDDDETGHKARDAIIKRLGHVRCRMVVLPMNDANECLQQGYDSEDIKECIKKATSLDPHELRRASEYLQEILDRFYPPEGRLVGYESAWDKSRDKIRFRPSELSVWTGTNGHGKTQFLGHLMLGKMEQGARVCIASLELKPGLLLSRLTKQATGMNLPSPDYVKKVTEWFYDKLWIFDLTGTAKAQRLIEVFIYARQRYGIDTFVIDSFAKLDMADDDYKGQKVLMNQLCDFKNEYDCHVHLVVHPRKGADETNMPGKLDTKGSGCITDLADNCFTVWRNKAKEAVVNKVAKNEPITDKEQEKLLMPDSLWCCDKQRDGDWEGNLSFWYDSASFQYLSYEKQKPQRIVTFSCLES